MEQMPDTRQELATAHEYLRAGKPERAESIYRSIVKTEPDCAEAWHLLGVIELHYKNPTMAEAYLQKAIAFDGGRPRYHGNLGIALASLGNPGEAEECFRRAIEIDPGYAEAHYNLGNLLRDDGRPAEAEEAYERALEIDPDNINCLNNLGLLQLGGHRLGEAEDCFRRALDTEPESYAALWNLANCLEQRNRLEEARELSGQLSERFPEVPAVKLMAARLARRAGSLEEAEGLLGEIVEGTKDKGVLLNSWFELGQVLDRLDRPQEAFEAFLAGNCLEAEFAGDSAADGAAYLARVEEARSWFTAERLAAWKDSGVTDDGPSPVFFVGFPRSGTTLFEQVLAAHPNLVTTGERSPLEMVRKSIEQAAAEEGKGYPECLVDMTPSEVAKWRGAFRDQTREILGQEAARLRTVEKLPLDLVRLGLVNRLFPEAKVIVALRDPRDACLSCFMQQFRYNQAMANFLRLETTAGLYSAVMGLWLHYRQALTLSWIEYRYEDLIADLEGTTRRVLDFLGEPWSEEMLSYREAAAARDISTPSYRDVGDEIHSRAAGRWRGYREQLAPILPRLKPFIKAFGYDRG